MKIKAENTVAEIVVNNIKAAHIFKKHGIDFCCGGGISIQKACEKYNASFSTLKEEIEALDNNVSRAYDYDKWELDFLIDHIINVHHTYVQESIPMLIQYANKVAKVHGHHYKELVRINELVINLANDLMAHLQKEEVVLFPYVKEQVTALREGRVAQPSHFGSVNNPINVMFQEHDNAGSIFKEIAKLTNGYTPPENACNTFRALYSKLEEFEQDLHQHVHLENNILFPKAIRLEN